jgi:hypothetical protein
MLQKAATGREDLQKIYCFQSYFGPATNIQRPGGRTYSELISEEPEFFLFWKICWIYRRLYAGKVFRRIGEEGTPLSLSESKNIYDMLIAL